MVGVPAVPPPVVPARAPAVPTLDAAVPVPAVDAEATVPEPPEGLAPAVPDAGVAAGVPADVAGVSVLPLPLEHAAAATQPSAAIHRVCLLVI